MLKITLSATAFALALSGAALAQTSVDGGASVGAEAGTCSTLLADLESRVGGLAGTVGGVVDSAGGAVGGVRGGLGLGASGSASTPAGSADAAASASGGASTEAVDVSAVSDLLNDARAALDSGDEEQCLTLAAEAEQALGASVQ